MVQVKDKGRGLGEDEVDQLFKENNSTDYVVGMGLNICQKIIDKVGGTIKVFSKGIDKGTTFHFTMKMASPNVQQNIEAERSYEEEKVATQTSNPPPAEESMHEWLDKGLDSNHTIHIDMEQSAGEYLKSVKYPAEPSRGGEDSDLSIEFADLVKMNVKDQNSEKKKAQNGSGDQHSNDLFSLKSLHDIQDQLLIFKKPQESQNSIRAHKQDYERENELEESKRTEDKDYSSILVCDED